MTAFVEGIDYRWLSQANAPWWHRLWIIQDYVERAKLLHRYAFKLYEHRFVIPKGYEWNGASLGFPASRDEPSVMRASLVHDWLYDTKPDGVTRREADLILIRFLKEDHAPEGIIQGAYAGMHGGVFQLAWENGLT